MHFKSTLVNLAIRKNFQDVMVEDELWQWVEGPLLDGYYLLPLKPLRKIGNIQVRTGRVKSIKCGEDLNRRIFQQDRCYPEFNTEVEETQDYGPSSSVTGQQYSWSGNLGRLYRSLTFSSNSFHSELHFGEGGYDFYIPRDNETAGRELVKELKLRLIVPGTRYVAFSFTLYNPNTNAFSIFRIVFDFSHTGWLERTAFIKTTPLNVGWSKDPLTPIVASLLTLALVIREVAELRQKGVLKFIFSIWNILDCIQIGLLFTWGTYFVWMTLISNALWHDVEDDLDRSCVTTKHDVARKCFTNFQEFAWTVDAHYNTVGYLVLVSTIITCKYLRLNARLNLVWRTLQIAAWDLAAFVSLFIFLFFGFAVNGYVIFGSQVRGFHSIVESFATAFSMLLGDFNLNELYEANPRVAKPFFYTYMIFVVLIFINMFIAIVSEYYSLAQKEKREHEEHLKTLDRDDHDNLELADYDLIKQVQRYFKALRLRVDFVTPSSTTMTNRHETPTTINRSGSSIGGHLAPEFTLCDNEHVLLIDREFYIRERKKLRRKFRATVHLVRFCIRHFGHRWTRVKSEDCTDFELINCNNRRRPESTRPSTEDPTTEDFMEYPVKFLPLSSQDGNVSDFLSCLPLGSKLIIDDGSLTTDQITFEVIGNQSAYAAPVSGSASITMMNMRDSSGSGNSNVDILNNDEDGRILNNPPRPFGFRPNLKSSQHIRCCRVSYDGQTHLEGNEWCKVGFAPWLKFLILKNGLPNIWGWVMSWFCRKELVDGHQRIDLEMLEELVAESIQARGRYCRFDEVRRTFRLYFAKIYTVTSGHDNTHNLLSDEEAVAFAERFKTALEPLDARALRGYAYVPHPTDTTSVKLPRSVNRLSEFLSYNAHEVWAENRMKQGWTYGKTRDNALKKHPNLVGYEDLTEEDKQYDRDTSIETLKLIQALGYILESNDQSSSSSSIISSSGSSSSLADPNYTSVTKQEEALEKLRHSRSSSFSETLRSICEKRLQDTADVVDQYQEEKQDTFCVDGPSQQQPPHPQQQPNFTKTYVPQPVDTDHIQVSSELNSLVELLAENTHEIWAKKRIEQGWTFGPSRDDEKLEHNGLVPYESLSKEEKQFNRDSAIETVKLILCSGFKFRHRSTAKSASTKSQKWSGTLSAKKASRSLIHSQGSSISSITSSEGRPAFPQPRLRSHSRSKLPTSRQESIAEGESVHHGIIARSQSARGTKFTSTSLEETTLNDTHQHQNNPTDFTRSQSVRENIN